MPAEDLPVTPMVMVTATATPGIGIALVTLAPPTAAVLQTTPTPLPTATPTATPTPIVYIINEGDTLLAIAIERRTTVEEIVALNPGIQPALLQIGQAVVLPPPATAMAQGVAGTPIPIQVEVNRASSYQTPVGSLWLLGEVTNQGEFPVANVQVEIVLVDEAGNQVGTAAAWVAAAVIPPGGAAPFGVLINEAPAGFAQPVVAVTGGETVRDLGSRYLDLALLDTTLSLDDERVQVRGRVQNTGAATAGHITLVATFYDHQGNVAGFHQVELDGLLAPSESLAFTFTTTPPGGRPVDYHLSLQSVTMNN